MITNYYYYYYIGERSQIKEQDLNRQLCRRLNLGEDLDLGCRDIYIYIYGI